MLLSVARRECTVGEAASAAASRVASDEELVISHPYEMEVLPDEGRNTQAGLDKWENDCQARPAWSNIDLRPLAATRAAISISRRIGCIS